MHNDFSEALGVIFSGPTLRPKDASDPSGLVWLPPAAEGDLLRVALGRPRAIGLIDGYFETCGAVRHYEITCALDQGIPVYGAASMGALRAAELHSFGMVGVGKVFEAYRDGRLEADDEVAVSHAPAAFEYRPLTEALVNIRATLERAVAADVISLDLATIMIDAARGTYFKKRSYETLLDQLAVEAHGTDVATLRHWLQENKVDQKRLDALAMVQMLLLQVDQPQASSVPRFALNSTPYLRRAIERTIGASDR